jgi:cyanobactin maturation PatA/PatG family protease
MRVFQPTSDLLAPVRAGLAHDIGSPDVVVGIVDGLPDLAHPCLAPASIEILQMMIPPGVGSPDSHGTGVCSLIFGQDDAVRGIAPACAGLVLPIFFGTGPGATARSASQLDLARAITFAIENGASIINVSAGQKTFTAEAETHLEQAIQRCAERRILIVAASGNDGCDCIHLPAAMPCVLAVGASGTDRRPLPASNWGALYHRNGILAPGENLIMAALDRGVTQATGTSYAAAIVSGVAAVLLSIARAEGYKIDPVDVRQILMDSATPCTLARDGACDRYLAGSLDTAAALAMLHRIGAASRSPALQPGIQPSTSSAVHTPIASQTRGSSVMLDSISDMSAAATQPPPGLLPSDLSQAACSCQIHDDDEHDDVTLQGIAAEPEQAMRSPAIAQSGIASALIQQGCSCGGGKPPQIVYAIGSLWFDFGTEARYDAIVQQIGDPVQANNPTALFAFLRANPQFMSGITFILMQDQIPLYAIQPIGTFALPIYTSMLDALDSSITERGTEQRISLPGFVGGSARLMNGMNVPIVFPDLRGMYMWRSADLVEATESMASSIPSPPADEAVIEFLNRVYYELRNLGISPQERAMNYAATNAYQARQAFADAAARNYALDSIQVVRSPICRPDSDCWDVKLQMFDPENERRAGRVYRYTVDVSEVIPVTVGPVRNWAVRLGA